MTFRKNRKFTKNAIFRLPTLLTTNTAYPWWLGGCLPTRKTESKTHFQTFLHALDHFLGRFPPLYDFLGKSKICEKCDFSPPDPPHHQNNLSLVAGGLPPNPLNTVETTFSRLVTCPRPLFGSFPAIIRLFGKIKNFRKKSKIFLFKKNQFSQLFFDLEGWFFDRWNRRHLTVNLPIYMTF